MTTAAETDAIARRFIEEYNRGSPDWVETMHAETSEWVELPFFGSAGRRGDRTALRAAAEAGLVGFPDRRMEILSVVAGEGRAAVEVLWTGTAAVASSWAAVGETLRLQAVMLLTIEAGKLVREVDYVIPLPLGG